MQRRVYFRAAEKHLIAENFVTVLQIGEGGHCNHFRISLHVEAKDQRHGAVSQNEIEPKYV